MQSTCSFKSVIIYGDLVFVSSDNFTIAERFLTKNIKVCDIPFRLSSSFTRFTTLGKMAYYVCQLFGCEDISQLSSVLEYPFPFSDPKQAVDAFLYSIGFTSEEYAIDFPGVYNFPSFIVYDKK